MITLENKFVSIAVKEYGAELASFKSKESGIEYLWQGNPDVWYGQSPVLFPIIGMLLNDKCVINGKEYEIPKHGIARKRDFALKEKGENYIILTQSYDDETLKKYPYKYTLDVKFELDGKKLTATHYVSCEDSEPMYFSIGGHPGFNCKIGDWLEFEENETLQCEKIGADALLDGKHYPTLTNEKKLEITEHIFDGDAHILSDMKSDTVYLKSNYRPQVIKFNFGKVPILSFWAKPGAEYVCIEPWYGINDTPKFTPDFSLKRLIQKIENGEVFEFPWSAEIIE